MANQREREEAMAEIQRCLDFACQLTGADARQKKSLTEFYATIKDDHLKKVMGQINDFLLESEIANDERDKRRQRPGAAPGGQEARGQGADANPQESGG